MTETHKQSAPVVTFPSVDEVRPIDEGGSIARIGFNYQDEIAVRFLIQMLKDSSLVKIHCETQDDIVLVWSVGQPPVKIAEYIQVKGSEQDKLWSVADLCSRTSGRPGTSIFERSLARDKCNEESRFRLVTLRDVVSDLKFLTFDFGSSGREQVGKEFKTLLDELERRFHGYISSKGNGIAFWIKNCYWEQCHSYESVRKDNLLQLITLSSNEGRMLLPEQAETLLDELRAQAKVAGDARWEPDRNKKIILRDSLCAWWEKRKREVFEGTSTASGGKLLKKMAAASLPPDIKELATEMRRDYATLARTTTYMEPHDREYLQGLVKSEVISLRSKFIAGKIDLDGPGFHSLCLERMDEINASLSSSNNDRSAFLKGCLYDIADRCLLRFEKTP